MDLAFTYEILIRANQRPWVNLLSPGLSGTDYIRTLLGGVVMHGSWTLDDRTALDVVDGEAT